jgi:hypothetical protein
MRNVIGQFKNNALCKYDLKGSSINRKEIFEIDNVHKIVMKDVNFEEIEKYLLLSKYDIERLRFACTTDAYFLNDMDLMDYSLFVVKLSLNNEEIEEIFGKILKEENMLEIKNELIHEIEIVTNEINDKSLNDIPVHKNSIFKETKEIEHYRKYLYRSLNDKQVYIIAIIDYLQIYNFYKYLETTFKFYIKSRPENIEEISCVQPEIYCTRFIEYIKKITDIEKLNN